jgi:tRNA threonylcarbamoyladenosine biosynthesis protein TsaB
MTSRVLSVDPLKQGAAAGPILGIDTGAPVPSIGVVANGRVLASIARGGGPHGAILPELVDEALDRAGLKLNDIAAVAVAIGPGSFTGLRIGLSYAKGLVLGARCAIVGISTFDAMVLCALEALETGNDVLVCPIIDARRGEVYTSLYRIRGDALEKVTGDLVISLSDFAQRITGEAVLVGDAKAEEGRALLAQRGLEARVVGGAGLSSRGSFVAALGAARVANNDLDDAVALEPRYVRSSAASFNPP